MPAISVTRTPAVRRFARRGVSRRRCSARAAAATHAKLVVVGGGFGGATAARFAKRLLPGLSVTLVEPNESYVACPMSNLVVARSSHASQQTFSYAALAAEGIDVRHASATDIDPVARTVTLGGDTLDYDRLILAPGIDFRWDALEGYGQDAVELMPHAWKAGPQTTLLRRQLESMADGGVVVMSVTAAPFRCPPGPYERASLIAHYLAQHKPRAKLIVLDSNDRFSKQPLFTKIWGERYKSILEWRGASNDGRVVRVDPAAMTLHTEFEIGAWRRRQRRAAAAGGSHCTACRHHRLERLVSSRRRHLRIEATTRHSHRRRCGHRGADAEVGVCGECAGQGVCDSGGAPAERARARDDDARQHVLLVRRRHACDLDRGCVQHRGRNVRRGSELGRHQSAGCPESFRQAEANQAADWFRAITRETFLS